MAANHVSNNTCILNMILLETKSCSGCLLPVYPINAVVTGASSSLTSSYTWTQSGADAYDELDTTVFKVSH